MTGTVNEADCEVCHAHNYDDGTTIHTRTYCAPFFDDAGEAAGAVVTSGPLDIAVTPGLHD